MNLTIEQLMQQAVEIQAAIAKVKADDLIVRLSKVLNEAEEIDWGVAKTLVITKTDDGCVAEFIAAKVERISTGPREANRPLANCFALCGSTIDKATYKTLKSNTERWTMKRKSWDKNHSDDAGHGYIAS